jgi:hypothetical protein
MLPNANKQHRYIRGMHNADQRADHVSDGVTLRDDEAIQRPAGPKSGIEVPGLGD